MHEWMNDGLSTSKGTEEVWHSNWKINVGRFSSAPRNVLSENPILRPFVSCHSRNNYVTTWSRTKLTEAFMEREGRNASLTSLSAVGGYRKNRFCYAIKTWKRSRLFKCYKCKKKTPIIIYSLGWHVELVRKDVLLSLFARAIIVIVQNIDKINQNKLSERRWKSPWNCVVSFAVKGYVANDDETAPHRRGSN